MAQKLLPGPHEYSWQRAGRTFLWKTMQGEVLTLEDMQTSHLFNSAKMLFNHIAVHFNDATPVWFEKVYRLYVRECKNKPEIYAEQIMFFISEIERRGDLPEKYHEPYAEMLRQILPLALDSGFLIEAPVEHEDKQGATALARVLPGDVSPPSRR